MQVMGMQNEQLETARLWCWCMNQSKRKKDGFCYSHFFFFSTLQGILCNNLKSFFNICAFLGRSLKIWNISFRGTPCSSLFLRYLYMQAMQHKSCRSQRKYVGSRSKNSDEQQYSTTNISDMVKSPNE